jgi:hypothetical protein
MRKQYRAVNRAVLETLESRQLVTGPVALGAAGLAFATPSQEWLTQLKSDIAQYEQWRNDTGSGEQLVLGQALSQFMSMGMDQPQQIVVTPSTPPTQQPSRV